MALFLSLNSNLRMFAPIVSANPYCTLYSCCNVTPYHKWSLHAKEEIQASIGLGIDDPFSKVEWLLGTLIRPFFWQKLMFTLLHGKKNLYMKTFWAWVTLKVCFICRKANNRISKRENQYFIVPNNIDSFPHPYKISRQFSFTKQLGFRNSPLLWNFQQPSMGWVWTVFLTVWTIKRDTK